MTFSNKKAKNLIKKREEIDSICLNFLMGNMFFFYKHKAQ